MNLSSFTNPVYPGSLPDPYVLRHKGEFWAYGSEKGRDGRYFKILHSLDLVRWDELTGALEEQPGGYSCYWAPEVSYLDGYFYLYYSLGDGTRMSIRVAKSSSPAGPFVDCSRCLTQEDFAIDPHVFIDDDGSRYLFYATDFLDHPFIGTGTVFDRLLDPTTLAGSPCPVTRGRYAWQVYDPHRDEKGGVCWYTLEGPCVLKHKRFYYQMFSGGNWQNTSYGVGYASTSSLACDSEWEQACDGIQFTPILHSIPEAGIIGPGHNSVVRGPDNRQLFCVYHRWITDATGSRRAMAIDRLEFIGDRMVIIEPSNSPQIPPILPTYSFFTSTPGENFADLTSPWQVRSGNWKIVPGALVQDSVQDLAEINWNLPSPMFHLEIAIEPVITINPKPGATNQSHCGWGVNLYCSALEIFQILVLPDERCMMITMGDRSNRVLLPSSWLPGSTHMLSLDVNHLLVNCALYGTAGRWQGKLQGLPSSLALLTYGMAASFSALQWTGGWEDNFDLDRVDLSTLGWFETGPQDAWSIKDFNLHYLPTEHAPVVVYKEVPAGNYELVINFKLDNHLDQATQVGFGPFSDIELEKLMFTLHQDDSGFEIRVGNQENTSFKLPTCFDPFIVNQFRLIKNDKLYNLYWQAQELGQFMGDPDARYFGISGYGSPVSVDLVRVTSILSSRV